MKYQTKSLDAHLVTLTSSMKKSINSQVAQDKEMTKLKNRVVNETFFNESLDKIQSASRATSAQG